METTWRRRGDDDMSPTTGSTGSTAPNAAAASGRHVLITGGSKGIGFEIARCFLSNPTARTDAITLLARNEKDLAIAKKKLRSEFPDARVETVVADTTEEEQLTKQLAKARETLGPIDVLVCNAGLSIPKLIVDSTVEDYERQMNVNYLGAVRSVHAVLPDMMARKSGHLVFVSSVAGVLGFAGYSASWNHVLLEQSNLSRSLALSVSRCLTLICTLRSVVRFVRADEMGDSRLCRLSTERTFRHRGHRLCRVPAGHRDAGVRHRDRTEVRVMRTCEQCSRKLAVWCGQGGGRHRQRDCRGTLPPRAPRFRLNASCEHDGESDEAWGVLDAYRGAPCPFARARQAVLDLAD